MSTRSDLVQGIAVGDRIWLTHPYNDPVKVRVLKVTQRSITTEGSHRFNRSDGSAWGGMSAAYKVGVMWYAEGGSRLMADEDARKISARRESRVSARNIVAELSTGVRRLSVEPDGIMTAAAIYFILNGHYPSQLTMPDGKIVTPESIRDHITNLLDEETNDHNN